MVQICAPGNGKYAQSLYGGLSTLSIKKFKDGDSDHVSAAILGSKSVRVAPMLVIGDEASSYKPTLKDAQISSGLYIYPDCLSSS